MKTKKLIRKDILRPFDSSDIGKVFWRVEYIGVLTQCIIHEIKEDNKAVVKLSVLTDFSTQKYKLRSDVDYWGRSTYGTDTLRKSNEYYYDLDEAKKASLERFYSEANPNGRYKVARYFDDVFECFVTIELTKNDAQIKCDELNKMPRSYVSYGIVSTSINKDSTNRLRA